MLYIIQMLHISSERQVCDLDDLDRDLFDVCETIQEYNKKGDNTNTQ